MVSGSRDHTVRVWSMNSDSDDQLPTNRQINMHERVWSVAMHPDAK